MTSALRVWLASPWTHAAALALVTLWVLSSVGPHEAPLLGDQAYFTYLGQCVLRGQAIYEISFMGYPPVVPLLTGGAMWVGGWFGVTSYLAPRYLVMAVAIANVVAIYVVTRRATASPWAGLLAGTTLAGFSGFAQLSVSNLEPKLVVMFFGLAASVAIQKKRWLATGLASGLAGMCWQPALLVTLCSLPVTLWGGRGAGWRPLRSYTAGMLLALLPTLLYLGLTDTWWDFWQRSIVIPATSQIPRMASSPLLWARTLWMLVFERAFSSAAIVGLALFVVSSARGGLRGLAQAWLEPAAMVAAVVSITRSTAGGAADGAGEPSPALRVGSTADSSDSEEAAVGAGVDSPPQETSSAAPQARRNVTSKKRLMRRFKRDFTKTFTG